jgi:multiple sugar transport system permease protein
MTISARSPAVQKARPPSGLNNQVFVGYLFILPALIGFAIFYLYPAVKGLLLSFTDYSLLSTKSPNNIGLDNYNAAIHDPKFWDALWITVKYVLWNIPLQTALSLMLAVAMDRVVKGMFLKGLLILPYLLSNVLVAMVFVWMLDPQLGIINQWLQSTFIGKQYFFSSTDQAIPTIAFVNIWRHMGFNALLFYAGLQAVPKTVYEAANIDGASESRVFWSMTLPLVRPVTIFVLVTSLIGSFQIFDTVSVATQGGPVDSTQVLVYYIYKQAFNFNQMGYATAMSMLLFAMLALFTLLQLRVFRANESDLE